MILGKHSLADLYSCHDSNLDNIDVIREYMLLACKEANLNVIDFNFHKFEPYGVSGVCILKESHIAIHTWPEHNFVSIDAFTCGTKMNPSKACQILGEKYKCEKIDLKEFERGCINE